MILNLLLYLWLLTYKKIKAFVLLIHFCRCFWVNNFFILKLILYMMIFESRCRPRLFQRCINIFFKIVDILTETQYIEMYERMKKLIETYNDYIEKKSRNKCWISDIKTKIRSLFCKAKIPKSVSVSQKTCLSWRYFQWTQRQIKIWWKSSTIRN